MSKRNISNRSLRQRFFGWIRPSVNDNFNISHLLARIASEQKNLEGRYKAVAKYERFAELYKKHKTIRDQSLEMAKIEREALPHIQKHIEYLQKELQEEQEKAKA